MAACCVAATIFAQGCARGDAQLQDSFLSLFADSSRQHDAYCAFSGDQAIIELWVYSYPSIRGQRGAEFRIEYPSNVIPSPPIFNEEIASVHAGDPATGMRFIFEECQWNTNWCLHQFLILTTHDLALIDIVPIRFSNCDTVWAHEPVKKWKDLYVNYEEGSTQFPRRCKPPLWTITSTQTRSWGAIKAFRRISDD